jgi:hypothetical protein
MLHVLTDLPIDYLIFNQRDISYLRTRLHDLLSDPTSTLSPKFMYSFFPQLCNHYNIDHQQPPINDEQPSSNNETSVNDGDNEDDDPTHNQAMMDNDVDDDSLSDKKPAAIDSTNKIVDDNNDVIDSTNKIVIETMM